MANILVVSGFLPSRTSPSSGQKIVYEKLRTLSRTNEVYLLAFVNRLESDFYATEKIIPGSDLGFLAGTEIIRLKTHHRLLGALLYWRLPLLTSGRQLAGRRRLSRLLSGRHFSAVVAEFEQGASLIPPELHAVTTLVAHDVFNQAYKRRAQAATGLRRLWLKLEYHRIRKWESYLMRRVAEVVVLNDKDRGLVESVSGRRDARVEYPTLADYLRKVERDCDTIVPGTILFWGHMARAENKDAVCWFASKIFPAVQARHPASRFIIAGAEPGPEVLALAGPSVEVTGYLPDPTALFERAAAAVVPLRHGGGIKIKTLETTSLGIPTVATEIGAEGVRACEQLIVADSAADIAAALGEILDRS